LIFAGVAIAAGNAAANCCCGTAAQPVQPQQQPVEGGAVMEKIVMDFVNRMWGYFDRISGSCNRN